MFSSSIDRLVIAGALVLVGAVAAAGPEQQAVKRFAADGKSAVKALNAELSAERATFEGAIDDFAAAARDANDFLAPLGNLMLATDAFQLAVRTSAVAAIHSIAPAGQSRLFAIGTVDAEHGIYPSGFYSGTGGVKDDVDAAVHAALAKTYAKVRKRVARVARRLEDHGVLFTFRIESSLARLDWDANYANSIVVPSFVVSCDFALSASRRSAAGDGTFAFGGNAPADEGALSITVHTPSGTTPQFDVTPSIENRYRRIGLPGATAFAEGDYLIAAGHGTVIETQQTIGLR